MATNYAPVIPEITKAYQNDPQTQLALAALKSGTSTAPVATRGYGYGDGAARVIQALVGALSDNSTEKKYNADQADLLALRQQRGQDGLNGMGTPGIPPPAPAASPVAQGMPGMDLSQAAPSVDPGAINASTPDATSAIAAALGGQSAPSAQGGGPAGQVPFGPDPSQPAAPAPQPPPQAGPAPSPQVAAVANALAGPQAVPAPAVSPLTISAPAAAPSTSRFGVHEALPDAPAVVGRPTTPTAVPAQASPTLTAAYKIMRDANPYESAQGQDMYGTGLGEQNTSNEAALKRQQALNDMGYNTDLQRYSESTDEATKNAYAQRMAAQTRNFGRDEKMQEEGFTGGQNDKNRAKDLQVANIEGASKIAAARAALGSGTDDNAILAKAASDGKLDPLRVTKFNRSVLAQSFRQDPNFDATSNHGLAQMAASAPLRQKASMAVVLPDVLKNVRDAGQQLNLSDAQFAGKMQQYLNGQLNDPAFTKYMTMRNDAMQSLSNVMRGTGATDLSTKLESDAAPKTMSPRALQAWYNGQMTALKPRLQQAEQNKLVQPGTVDSVYGKLSSDAGGSSVMPRKPGESVSQYLARTGQ